MGLDGSIDWCCLPLLDSPSVFGAILDPDRGGHFSIRPARDLRDVRQEYLQDTNVLRTVFTTATGELELLDWMPMGGFTLTPEENHCLPAVYRLARCLSGTVELTAEFHPRCDYGRAAMTFATEDGGFVARAKGDTVHLHTVFPMTIDDRGVTGTHLMKEGEDKAFLCAYGGLDPTDLPPPLRSLERTVEHWKHWANECEDGACPFPGGWENEVKRSCLMLRILAGGRGIAAAATTSLPEMIGADHNWDYRFSWVRDSAFTVRALTSAGHFSDAVEFFEWIVDLLHHEGRRPADLRVLYPLHGGTLSPEQELIHLRGYGDSRPVRIGNAAADQRQLDLYGEILNAVYAVETLPTHVSEQLGFVLRDIVEYVCGIWKEPDYGIWELRDSERHYTYSKVMCWVALDRGIRLAVRHGWKADIKKWKKERDAIHADVMDLGWSEKRQAFMQSYGSDILDASAALFPILGFLPPDHPRVLSTIEAVERDLGEGPLVYRSERHRGKEGAFGFCSFWLAEAEVLCGKRDKALWRFQELLKLANHVGLFAEEIDPKSGAFLGNFPQAFTHVGLINVATALGARKS